MIASPPSVCAVVPSGRPLGEQTLPPQAVVVAEPGPLGLATAVTEALTTGASWLWLLDATVTPEPTALAELLAPVPLAAELGQPVLFSSKVVDPSGRLDPEVAPWPRLLARELAMTGADHRLAALRAARYGSLLVDRRAAERHGPPRPDFASAGGDLEWTGRLLRDVPGYLAPRSVVVRTAGPPDAGTFIRERVRILRGDGWLGQEKAWFAFLLGQELSQRIATRPAEVAEVTRGVARGLRAPR